MNRSKLSSGAAAFCQLAMMFLAAITVIASALAALLLIPGNVIFVGAALGHEEFAIARGWPWWFFVIWFPAALLLAVRNTIAGVDAFREPTLKKIGILVASSLIALATCPALE